MLYPTFRKSKLLIFMGKACSISQALKFEKLTTLWGNTRGNVAAGFVFPLCSLNQFERSLLKHRDF